MKIDISTIQSVEELHQVLAKNLNFPEFYGNNWNAFWDAITGLVSMPEHLELSGLKNIHSKFPKDALILIDLTNEFNKRYSSTITLIE